MNIMRSDKKYTYLFETICMQDGVIKNEKWHLERMIRAIKKPLKFSLSDFNQKLLGVFRLKVVYDEVGNLIYHELTPYKIRSFCEFNLKNINFSYEKKFLDRGRIDKIKGENNEIIMIKNGLITDTSIANIAILRDNIWLTPKTPLLAGTTRARLLKQNFLKPADITPDMLKAATKFAIMNAMIGFLHVKEPKFIDERF